MQRAISMKRSKTALAQGIVWLVTGLWPVIHLRSFEAVTGRKKESWLVKTTGLLIACIGAELLRRPSRSLGATAAAALAVVDVIYGGTGRISRVYLADAVLQTGFLAAWLAPRRAPRTEPSYYASEEEPEEMPNPGDPGPELPSPRVPIEPEVDPRLSKPAPGY